MNKPTILCVDDEIDNVEALERLFRKSYRVLKATSGAEGLSILAQDPGPIALIISDQKMPLMTGVEMLEKSIAIRPDTMRILLTGYTDLDSVIQAVNQGQIFRYLTKPWDPTDLSNTVEHAIRQFQLKSELAVKNKELSQALSELKSLDQAKSNFMLLINHELKTPLTSILSYSQLLKESLASEDDLKMLGRIHQGAEKLRALIEDVLLIMRAETGQLKLEMQPMSISGIEDIVPAEVIELAKKKNMTFQFHLDATPVVGDPRILRQIFTRLVHNAVKFGDADTAIQISKTKAPDGFMISIKNQGPKISEEILPQLAKLFYIDENIMHHSTGTGLGLAITQSLLKSFGSTLKIGNSPQGVTVQFKLIQ